MARAALVPILLMLAPAVSAGADRTGDARRYYNQALYELAIKAASEARDAGESADEAGIIIARAHLERFRQTRDAKNLTAAREALRAVDASGLTPAQKTEFALALGEWLFFDDKFRAAAEMFDSAVAQVDGMGPAARDRVLDWWATAVDQQAQVDPANRQALYQRIIDRMEAELRLHPGSAAAGYWVAAAARSMGDPERAWHAALAGYLRARVAADRGQALRADLDQLVTTAIIPERARLSGAGGGQALSAETMADEWEQLKALWN